MKTFSLFNRLSFAALFLAMGIITAGCDSSDPEDEVTLNIVETATDSGFNTLVAAVEAADLVSVLEGDGPFTVFAPTDAAFANLPAGTLDNLLLPENQTQLASVLTYHVVSGRVTADDVVNLTTATTVQGEELAITVVEGVVYLNGVEVSQTDVEATNGIIHVINGVLLPPSLQ